MFAKIWENPHKTLNSAHFAQDQNVSHEHFKICEDTKRKINGIECLHVPGEVGDLKERSSSFTSGEAASIALASLLL